MSKVTSKLQVTLPKALARQYAISPGSDITFEPAGDAIRVTVGPQRHRERADALALFDAATHRQRAREVALVEQGQTTTDRGWRREDLYSRGMAR